MANKKITKEDIAPKGIFDNVTEGAKQAKIQIDLLNEAVKILQQNAKKIKGKVGGASKSDTKSMKDFDEQARRANQTAKAKLGIDKQLTHHKAKLSQLQRDENKAIRTTIEAQSKLSQKQKQSLGTLQKLELSSRKLRAERAKLNLETKKGSQRLGEINRKLDQNNAKIRASGDAMKKQRMNVGNYGGAIGKLTGLLGKLGLGFGVFTLVKNAFNVVKNFEQSQANLASVLGVSTDKMKALTDQAKLLGSTTTFTASQVAELQIEFAKLGFTQEQIEGMATSTLLLAEATGSDLGESATVVGATMRGFGLDVSETQRVVDVMANSFSKSSLDMSKFSTAMSAVAPVAKLAGLNVEQTTALLGTLTDRGIEASTAGTGLRNMFLQANKHGLTFNEALSQIENSTDQTGTALELFGTRGATLGVILANNGDQVDDLTKKLYASEGAAQKMAETQRNTLGGSISLLTSAWEGWILKQNEAGGASDKLRGVIDFLSENLETLLSWVMFAVKQFILFKSAMLASKLAIISFNAVARLTSTSMGGLVKATKKMDKGMKSTGIGLLVSLLIQLVYWIYEAVTAESQLEVEQRERLELAKALREEEEAENDAFDEGIAGFKAMTEVLKKTNAGSRERESLIKKINDKYGTTLKNLKDEKKFMQQINIQVDAYIKLQKTRFLQSRNQKKMTAQLVLQVEAEENIARLKTSLMKDQGQIGDIVGMGSDRSRLTAPETMGSLRKRWSIRGGELTKWERQLSETERQIDALGGTAVALETEVFEAGVFEVTDDPTPTPTATTPQKKISLIRQIEDAEIKLIEDVQEREELARAQSWIRLQEDTKAKKTDLTEFNKWREVQEKVFVADIIKINQKHEDQKEAIRKKSELAIMQSSITEKEIELNKIADIFENYDETEAIRKKIDEEKIELLRKTAEYAVENTKLSEGEKIKIITDSDLKIAKIEEDAVKRNLKHKKEERTILQEKFSDAEKKKRLELLRSADDQETISAKMLDFQIEQLEKLIEIYKEKYPLLTKEIQDMEISLAEKNRQRRDKATNDEKDGIKEMSQLRQNAIQEMTNFFVKKTDERISALDKEIAAHEIMADHLAQMARDGNISAKESLAEENRLIAEAEQEKAEQERRKQRILMVSTFIKTYLAQIDAGEKPEDAMTKALTSQVFLEQVVNNLGSFFDGTEDTGTVSNGLDSNGGRMAVLHNNERVMTAKQNSRIGNVSNEEVARVMENQRMGKLIDGNQIAVGWDNILLIEELNAVGSKLDMVNKTIKDKPETNIQLGSITQKTMEIIESKRKGGLRTINTFKVKPL